jgi:type II secretory pathway component GspD/PulD (secretin)
MLRIMSGSQGYIRVGEEIPYTTRWIELTRRYARVVESVGFQRIDTGFEVRPIIQGEMADIEIVPRISEPGGDGRGSVIRLTEAATRMTVPLGQWVTIGASSQESNEAFREILATGRSSGQRTISMAVRVEAQ